MTCHCSSLRWCGTAPMPWWGGGLVGCVGWWAGRLCGLLCGLCGLVCCSAAGLLLGRGVGCFLARETFARSFNVYSLPAFLFAQCSVSSLSTYPYIHVLYSISLLPPPTSHLPPPTSSDILSHTVSFLSYPSVRISTLIIVWWAGRCRYTYTSRELGTYRTKQIRVLYAILQFWMQSGKSGL